MVAVLNGVEVVQEKNGKPYIIKEAFIEGLVYAMYRLGINKIDSGTISHLVDIVNISRKRCGYKYSVEPFSHVDDGRFRCYKKDDSVEYYLVHTLTFDSDFYMTDGNIADHLGIDYITHIIEGHLKYAEYIPLNITPDIFMNLVVYNMRARELTKIDNLTIRDLWASQYRSFHDAYCFGDVEPLSEIQDERLVCYDTNGDVKYYKLLDSDIPTDLYNTEPLLKWCRRFTGHHMACLEYNGRKVDPSMGYPYHCTPNTVCKDGGLFRNELFLNNDEPW